MTSGNDALDYEQLAKLFNNVNLPRYLLQQWLLIPEFTHEVSILFENQQPISNATILPIMEGIYSEYDSEMLSRGYHINGANFASLRKSIRRLYKVLNSNSIQEKR